LVRRVEWRFRLSREDAIELVQDAFVLALTRLDEERNPKAWIYAVVDRLAANWKRKVVRRGLLLARWQPSGRAEGASNAAGVPCDYGEDS
jgi:DNA-directed RNA polymerase specialized sigma24 family protein